MRISEFSSLCDYTAPPECQNAAPVTLVTRSLTAARKRERRGKADGRNLGFRLSGKPSGEHFSCVLALRENSFQTPAPVWVFKLKSLCIFLAHDPHLSKTNLFFLFYSEYLKEYSAGKISYPTWKKKIDLYTSYPIHETAVRFKEEKKK